MTGGGRLIEIQAGGEEATFSRAHLDEMVGAGEVAIRQVVEHQAKAMLSDCEG